MLREVEALRIKAGLSRRNTMLSQLPITVLMIGYTLLGLWLLSTPVVG